MKIRKERINDNSFKNICINYFSFYNKNLKKKHIIIYIISLIVFAYFTKTLINNSAEIKQFIAQAGSSKVSVGIISNIIKEKIPLIFLFIFSGITPYVFIPVVGIIGYPYLLSVKLINMSFVNILIGCIGSVVQIFGISLAIAAGIYYCTCCTKKFRYDQFNMSGLDDIKEQIYEATKKEEKLKALREKRKVKSEKREKLNVKINYKALLLTGIISTIIVVITALITGV